MVLVNPSWQLFTLFPGWAAKGVGAGDLDRDIQWLLLIIMVGG